MQTIKIYTKGIHTYIKAINPEFLGKPIKSDGFNVQFGENDSITLKDSHVATIITTTENDQINGETIHYTIGDSNDFLCPANPFVSGGEYFKHTTKFENNSGVVIANIRDWRDPISTINLDIDEEIDPKKLYFCTISLKPFFKHLGIMGVIYGELDDKQKEQLFCGEFYNPETIKSMFPHLIVSPVEYDLNVDKWYFELYTGKIYNSQGQYSFEKVSDNILIDFDEYEKAISPEDV